MNDAVFFYMEISHMNILCQRNQAISRGRENKVEQNRSFSIFKYISMDKSHSNTIVPNELVRYFEINSKILFKKRKKKNSKCMLMIFVKRQIIANFI